ncbi:MAG: phosphodiester glycosidase family protein [Candidatus Neomarinimicrobiota bacterium]
MKRYLFYFFIFSFFTLSADDIIWTNISDAYEFPSSVKLFKGTRVAPALECFYLDVDLNDSLIAIRPYSSSSAKNVKLFARDVNCIAAVNGGYFGANIPYSTVITPTDVEAVNVTAVTRNSQSYPLIRSMFSLNTNFEPTIDWVYHFGVTRDEVYRFATPLNYAYNDARPRPAPKRADGIAMENILSAIGGGPILLKDSSVHITYDEEIMWGSGVGLNNSDPRTAVAYTSDNHVIILTADGRQAHSAGLSMTEMAEIFLEKGCIEAMNLDGGGSTQMAIPGGFINRPSEERPVPAILAITYRDSCRIPVESAYSLIIDTEDPNYVSRAGSWFASANSGYWGDTKALLGGVGDGSSICRFYTALNETSSCDVYAWWVADPNRSSDSPFVIIHQDGRDTVRVNQQENHAKWNYLGNYTFTSDPEMAVILSNLTSKGNYVVADAIKLSSNSPITIAESTSAKPCVSLDPALLSIYPNPFNPYTVISYDLPIESDILLRLLDLNGNTLNTIINQKQVAGHYNIFLDGSDYPSGLYICALSYEGKQINKKITLLK